MGLPPETARSPIQVRGWLLAPGNENSDRAKTGLPIRPAAKQSRNQAVLSSKRNTWATPSGTFAWAAASTIWRHSLALIAMGFSHSTGLACLTARSTSRKCQEFGVATNTASTCEDWHKASAESNARGMSYWRADSSAFSKVRRERAVTRQLRADWKPGISRLTAWSPNPTIPKLTMWWTPPSSAIGISGASSAARLPDGHLLTASPTGTVITEDDSGPIASAPVAVSTVNSLTNTDLWASA